VALLFALAPPALADSVAVQRALRAGEVQRGLALALEQARGGDAWAMDVVGLLYLSGPAPLERDYDKAYAWLEKAAAAGSGDAMSRLGEMHFQGLGRPASASEAVAWYRRGADAGSASAMNNLAACLLEGKGVARDVEAGLALLRRAAERDPAAQENLGRILRAGTYGAKDAREAASLFERAAARGRAGAMAALAQMHVAGEGVPADANAACRWAMLTHAKARPDAGALLGEACYTRLTREQMSRSVADAKRWIDEHPDAFGPLAGR